MQVIGAQRDEELGVVVVEDLIWDTGSVDASKNLDIDISVGFKKISIEGDRKLALKEGNWDIVVLELNFVLVNSLGGGFEECVDCEQEKVCSRFDSYTTYLYFTLACASRISIIMYEYSSIIDNLSIYYVNYNDTCFR